MIIEEGEGTQFKIKLPVFKKNIYLHLYNDFVSVEMLEILFPSLNESKNSQIFPSWHCPADPHMYLEETTPVRLHLSWLGLL